MPLRILVPASLLTVLAAAVAAGIVSAARTNAGLTINATPNPITTGEGVLIYGQLGGPHPGGQKIVLHRQVNPTSTFTVEQTTTTDATGLYKFARSAGAVTINQSWYATSAGASHLRSRTVHEHVATLLTLHTSATSTHTSHPLTFTGHILPVSVHVGEHVFLQTGNGSTSNSWTTIGKALIDAGSNYSITHDFHQPGAFDVRVVLNGDTHNTQGTSDFVTVVVTPVALPPKTTTTPTTTATPTTTTTTGTVVAVRANTPTAFSFTLSTAGQPKVVSGRLVRLTVPTGEVTFNVTNPISSILSHNFRVCDLGTKGKKCPGWHTKVLAPGAASATLTIDFTTPGTYEYLSSYSDDLLGGMRGYLIVK